MLVKHASITDTDLRIRLDEFEEKYGVPSSRLVDAFRTPSGHLDETEDFHEWAMTYAAWSSVKRRELP